MNKKSEPTTLKELPKFPYVYLGRNTKYFYYRGEDVIALINRRINELEKEAKKHKKNGNEYLWFDATIRKAELRRLIGE